MKSEYCQQHQCAPLGPTVRVCVCVCSCLYVRELARWGYNRWRCEWAFVVLANHFLHNIFLDGQIFLQHVLSKVMYLLNGHNIVAYRPVAKQSLGKQRPLLGNARNIHACDNRRTVFSMWSTIEGLYFGVVRAGSRFAHHLQTSVLISLCNKIMQATSRSHTKPWTWKCSQQWTRRSPTQEI
jgi:hypothetical protein